MNTFNRKITALTGVLAIGLFSSLAAQAAASTKPTDNPMCREVTRKIAVYPIAGHPSKSLRLPHFETRTYTACNHDNMKAKPDRTASLSAVRPQG
jgi:hypothetical protein